MKRFLKVVIFSVLISITSFCLATPVQTPIAAGAAATKIIHKLTQQQEDPIAIFAKNNILYFFYDVDCPYCQKFAPILQKFALKYNFKVIPLTKDGNALPEFPNTKMETFEAAKFGVSGAPMLYSENIRTHKKSLIADGYVSESELKANIISVQKDLNQ